MTDRKTRTTGYFTSSLIHTQTFKPTYTICYFTSFLIHTHMFRPTYTICNFKCCMTCLVEYLLLCLLTEVKPHPCRLKPGTYSIVTEVGLSTLCSKSPTLWCPEFLWFHPIMFIVMLVIPPHLAYLIDKLGLTMSWLGSPFCCNYIWPKMFIWAFILTWRHEWRHLNDAFTTLPCG